MRYSAERTCNIFPSLLTFILPNYGPTPKLAQHKHHVARRCNRHTYVCAFLFHQLYQPSSSMSSANSKLHFLFFYRCLLFYPPSRTMSIAKTENLAFFCISANLCILPVSLQNVNREISELVFFFILCFFAGFCYSTLLKFPSVSNAKLAKSAILALSRDCSRKITQYMGIRPHVGSL